MIENDVKLRALEPEDLDFLYKIENDSALWGVGNTNVPYSRYVLHDYIAHAKNDIYADQQVRLVVENGVGKTIGVADITNFDARNLRAEVGIVILREYRQQGYALKALQQISHYALNILHLHQLYGVADTANTASMELFRKAGYSHTGLLKDRLFDGKTYHDAMLMQLFL